MSRTIDKSATFARLPQPWPNDPLPEIRAKIARRPRKVIVLDDDPTGTQTVCDVAVVTRWDLETLRAEFDDDAPGFFILTNSRSLTAAATRALHHEIATHLTTAAAGRPFTVISRSDSTLRGHFPVETDALSTVLGAPDLLIIAPYFEAGGRYTIRDVHYVEEGRQLIPAAATPFARDTVFGYTRSNLPAWVEEKTGGRTTEDMVGSVFLDLIRTGGPDAVEQFLLERPVGSTCVVNACTPRDIEVFAAAALRVEARRSILYRSAASLVAARLGQAPQPPIAADQLATGIPADTGGLVIAGSHVPRTTAQLERLRQLRDIESVDVDVATLLDPDRRREHLEDVSRRLNRSLAAGRDVLVFTSRELVAGDGPAADLDIGRQVSDGLVQIVRSLEMPPRFLIAKGGITSSDIATGALEVRRASVLGQVLPGVPAWRLGPESRHPGLTYVIFPGNVGPDDAIAEAVDRFTRS